MTTKNILVSAVAVAALAYGAAAQTISISGTGASFPAPIYQKWFSDYHKLHSNIEINYQSTGSGKGIGSILDGTVDFGASDGPMTDAQLKTFHDKYGYDVLHFPTVVGADVPIYNIAGVGPGLNFTPEALAGIFLGKITKWNDPELTKANPKVKLPAADILVVHRADGSGTTYCWTDFLSKSSPEWKQKVGTNTTVQWPTGMGAPQNSGVSGQVKQTPGSIGYVELIYALSNNIPYGNVKNPAGEFVKPELASITAAVAGASKTMPDDFRVSIINAPGKNAYPISTFTWLLIPEQIKDATKKKVIKEFLAWMLTTGQPTAENLKYSRLPKEVVAKEQKAIAKIK
jgi:phosphate transport system substrate-binding protein